MCQVGEIFMFRTWREFRIGVQVQFPRIGFVFHSSLQSKPTFRPYEHTKQYLLCVNEALHFYIDFMSVYRVSHMMAVVCPKDVQTMSARCCFFKKKKLRARPVRHLPHRWGGNFPSFLGAWSNIGPKHLKFVIFPYKILHNNHKIIHTQKKKSVIVANWQLCHFSLVFLLITIKKKIFFGN